MALQRPQQRHQAGRAEVRPWRPSKLAAEQVLAEAGVCWELAAFTGSLRVFAPVSSTFAQTVRQLKPSFRAAFLHILSSPSCGNHHPAGVRWQLGTEAWEPLPSLSTSQGGIFSGNVELVESSGHIYVLAEAIIYGRKWCILQSFDPVSWEWNILTQVQCECEAFVELSGQLYILGRSLTQDGKWLPEMMRYDPIMAKANSNYECEALPSMPTPRCYVGAGVLDNCLYAVGGYSADKPFDGPFEAQQVAERFDPAGSDDDGPWTSLSPMKCPRFLCKTLAVKGSLYVLGGVTSSGIETAMERFDPLTETWSLLKPMPTAKGAIGVAECAGSILVFGGTDLKGVPTTEVDSYDPVAKRWRRLPDISCHTGNLGSAALVGPHGNMLAVFTELCKQDTDLVIQRYDEHQNADPISCTRRVPANRGHGMRVVMARDVE